MPVTAVTMESASITWVHPGQGNSVSVMLVTLVTIAKKVHCMTFESPVHRRECCDVSLHVHVV